MIFKRLVVIHFIMDMWCTILATKLPGLSDAEPTLMRIDLIAQMFPEKPGIFSSQMRTCALLKMF